MAEYEQEKRCCSVCDARKVCHVCGDQTLMACSDCSINFGVTAYVCKKSACRDWHETKCYGDGSRARIAQEINTQLNEQVTQQAETIDALREDLRQLRG